MKEKIRVLITGLGGPLGVSILKALNFSRLNTEVFGTDVFPDAVGLFRVRKGYLLPPAFSDEGKYLEELQKICRREKIAVLFPGSEQEMKVLAPVRGTFQAETGTLVLVNEPEILAITTDKWLTVARLQEEGIPVAFSALPEKASELLEKCGFPLIVKPRFGSGSRGLQIVSTQEQLDFFVRHIPNPVIQELLTPAEEEYTVGVFLDKPGHSLGTIIMKRFLAAGLTYKAEVVEDAAIDRVCRAAAQALGLLGPCNIQLRKTNEGPKIFEVNPRFSSTTVMRAYFGFNEPEMAIRKFFFGEALRSPQIQKGIALRFWHELYVPREEVGALGGQGFIAGSQAELVDNF